MENAANLLTSLDKINSSNLISVFIPSQGREVKFKLLTAKQHKDILGTIMDKNSSGITLSLILTNIIQTNSTEKIEYLTSDKTYILIALRAASLFSKVKIDDIEYDLNKILVNKLIFNTNLKTDQIKEPSFTINVSVPTLDKDASINRESKKKLMEVSADEDVGKQSLSEIYINEFIKYIDSIEFNNESGSTKVEFKDLAYNIKRQIIEKLSMPVATKLIDYSNRIKEEESKFLTDGDQKVNISIDQAFFTI